MKLKLGWQIAGIIINLSPTQFIRLRGDEVQIHIEENFRGATDPQLPDGMVVRVIPQGGSQEFVETSFVDPLYPGE